MNASALGICCFSFVCSRICFSVFVPAFFDLVHHPSPTPQDHQAPATTVAMGRNKAGEEVASDKHFLLPFQPICIMDPGLLIPTIFPHGLLVLSLQAIEFQLPLALY